MADAEPSLRELADDEDFLIGTCVRSSALRGDPEYQDALREHYNAVTCEGEMKMGALRPSRHAFDFEAADNVVAFAEENDMTVRGHTLVWHMSNPDWLTPWTHTGAQLRDILREHVHTVAGRYRGQVAAWDVVNEAVDDDGTMRESFWFRKLGASYLDRAFQWAHEVAPDADLYYNDYGADGLGEKSDAVYDLVEGMVDRGVPIDGVGLQMHALGERPDPDDVAANVERLRDLGLKVQVTEMDVAFSRDTPAEEARRKQTRYYGDLASAVREAGAEALVVWGADDGHSWVRNWRDLPDRFRGDPLLLDENYEPKPAYDAVRDALR
ncbi:MAG: endo-1,4-beta-xylanase [Halobacteriaceae archaeon]